MNPLVRIVAACALLGLAAGPLSAGATSLAPLTPDQMVDAADDIVEGTVLAVAPWTDDTGRVWTRAQVRIDRALKGAVARAQVITVEAPGGVADDGTFTQVPLAPRYAVDERVFLYLSAKRGGTMYGTVGLVMGKFTIRQNPADGSDMIVRFTRPTHEDYDARFIPHPPVADRVSLATTEQAVAARVELGWDGRAIPGISSERLREINKLQPGVK
ncbi:MAG: hypothetical protein EXR71_02980 [Myxococcales bacterium]|nr:hypothetical protein [Myxococcales bacterium]